MDSDLVSILLDLKGEISKVAEDSAATRAAVESLAGPKGRVTILEDTLASQARFQKWYNYAIVPILASLHEVARLLGVKV